MVYLNDILIFGNNKNEDDDVSHDKCLETIEHQECTVASHSWPTLVDHKPLPEHSPKTL